jgi:glycerol-3-phosphate dehydrogenase
VKGSHIVVPRLFDHSFAYIFQHPDRRIVFAIPYESDFTLIGTTDLEFAGDPAKVAIDQGEIDYLCELCNRYFSHPVCPADVVWAYSGVRPLLEDSGPAASALTRDYRLELNNEGAPLLSIFGGKITTSRKLAEDVVDRLSRSLLTDGKAWTATSCLPGGDLEGNGPSGITVHSFDDFVQEQQRRFQWLPEALVTRYSRAYGTRIEQLLSGCKALSDLGPEILPGLYETEAIYWMEREWALTAEDMLWRRSKLGLHISADEARKLAAWLMQRGSCHATRLA